MSKDMLPLCQHGDMTEIPPQEVHSYKCFNGKLGSRLKAVQNKATEIEKYKKLL